MGSYSSVKYDSNGNPLWEISRGGVAMAVDSACNVYVTNYQEGPDDPFNSNFATIKYDTDGNELWVATYNGPANSDSARAIAVDTTGHVYVTGSSTSSNGRRGYATIKYDSNGSVVWVAQLIRGSFADPVALAVDPAGNVYVTGTVFIVDPMDSRHVQGLYLTVKYDGNGNELWNKSYNRPNPLIYEPLDGASALSLDTSGNVYVTGRIEDLDTGQDYATIKYDTDGNELWVVRYNGPGSGFESGDSATAIAVDATDNVYVTGKSSGDYATVKYDSNGNELWVSRYNGPANGEDGAVAIAVDAAGNVYITGGSTSSDGTYDYATIKLKSDNTGSAVGGSSSGGGSRGCLIEAASEHHDHFNPSIVVLVLGCFIFLTTDALQYRKIK